MWEPDVIQGQSVKIATPALRSRQCWNVFRTDQSFLEMIPRGQLKYFFMVAEDDCRDPRCRTWTLNISPILQRERPDHSLLIAGGWWTVKDSIVEAQNSMPIQRWVAIRSRFPSILTEKNRLGHRVMYTAIFERAPGCAMELDKALFIRPRSSWWRWSIGAKD
jgi:hypothetical protein